MNFSQPRIVFAGGGNEQDSRPLDELFASWVGSGPLLYLPTALIQTSRMQAGREWLHTVFTPLGLTDITTWTDLTGRSAHGLSRFSAVYIGGGNTFYLLHQLRMAGLDRALTDIALSGTPLYGGSAGAIILGQNITSSAHIDEDVVGMSDLSGLNLAHGCTIWCHYLPSVARRVEEYVARDRVSVIALSERAGAYREGNQLFAAGYEPAHLFTPDQHITIAPGQEIVLS